MIHDLGHLTVHIYKKHTSAVYAQNNRLMQANFFYENH